jgi:transposase
MDYGTHAVGIMREFSTFPQIYLCRKFVDFRKSIDGLSAIVESELHLRPFDDRALFVFMSRRKNRVKILYWDQTGFALWYKRLEEARFCWPRGPMKEDVIRMTAEKLQWLLSGIDIWKIKTHAPLAYEKIG